MTSDPGRRLRLGSTRAGMVHAWDGERTACGRKAAATRGEELPAHTAIGCSLCCGQLNRGAIQSLDGFKNALRRSGLA